MEALRDYFRRKVRFVFRTTGDCPGRSKAFADPEFHDAIALSWAGLSSIRWLKVVPLTVIAFYVSLFILQLFVYPLWGAFATIDEQLQYYQVGRNFNERGFLVTALLPDLSTASDSDGHPYIYNHQPPGPQLLIGVLIRLFGERFEMIRLCFAAIFVAGMWAFLRFAAIMRSFGLYGLELAVLLVSPRVVMHSMDHPAYCAFPLVAFLPIVLVHRYETSGERRYLAAAAAVVFVGSIYLIYGPLFMIVIFWVLGAAMGLVPVRRTSVVLLVGAVVAGILVHLLQTVVLVGWWVFLKELAYTISNRMFGIPTRHVLREFYDSIGFVLYGDHSLSAPRFFKALDRALSFPGQEAWLGMWAVVVVVALIQDAIYEFQEKRVLISRAFEKEVYRAGRLILWILAAVLTPYLMFPAFAADYPLGGTNGFLLGILAIGAGGTVWAIGRRQYAQTRLGVACLLAVVLWATLAGKDQGKEASRVVRRITEWTRRADAEAGFVWVERNLSGRVVMTNVDPVVAGFFTREVAFGGCHRDAVLVDGVDATKCRVEFVRGSPDQLRIRPAAYLWVGLSNPFCGGPQDCMQAEDLKLVYPTLFESRNVMVFDLRDGGAFRPAIYEE